jgi:hypothetical protein
LPAFGKKVGAQDLSEIPNTIATSMLFRPVIDAMDRWATAMSYPPRAEFLAVPTVPW